MNSIASNLMCGQGHRHTCMGADAGFGDLLIGTGTLMCDVNGFDPGKEMPRAGIWSGHAVVAG